MPSPDRPDDATAPVRYRARHTTRYDYGEDVPVSHHLVHLAARPHPLQRGRRSQLVVGPTPAVRSDFSDYFGNPVSYVAVQEPHRWLEITRRIKKAGRVAIPAY